MPYQVFYVECSDKPMSDQLLEERSAEEHFDTEHRALARARELLEDGYHHTVFVRYQTGDVLSGLRPSIKGRPGEVERMILSEQRARTTEELDVREVARRKIDVFGCEARQIMLARAENYRRHGHFKTAMFWQAVADTVEAISEPVAK